jgi:hypothetical protein
MRIPVKSVVASCIAAVAAAAVYAEFILDFRTPVSGLSQLHALGASASLLMSGYNEKVAHYRGAYGDRAHVILDVSTGGFRVTVDGATVEEGQILRQFAGMYGMFVVTRHDGGDSIFPFAIEPGAVPQGHEPNIARLQNRFENSLPAQYLDFADDDWTRDDCASWPSSDAGPGTFANLLQVRSGTSCVVHWNRASGESMLINVTLANGDPWMRPFSRHLCRTMTEAALVKRSAGNVARPTYAACVLVDRPERTGPTGAQSAFTSDVYEVRSADIARIPSPPAVLSP